MIMAKILLEEKRNSVERTQKNFAKTKLNFRGMGLTVRKIYHQEISNNRSFRQSVKDSSQEKLQKPKIYAQPEIIQQTCSNFMKNYIDKLKRQRKRQKKKLQEANHPKPFEGSIGCNITSFPVIQHGKQKIMILQKLNPLSFRSSSLQPNPSSRTLNNDNITEIIKQIKQQRERFEERGGNKKRLSQGFPTLEQRQRKIVNHVVLEAIDGWQGDQDIQQYILDDYK